MEAAEQVSGPTLRSMTAEDWPAVHAIYAEGIAGGNATFESAAPAWTKFDGSKLDDHRHVALIDDEVAGWVAVSAVSARAVYAGVVEHSIYVSERARGRGVGSALLDALIESTERAGIWTIQAGIFPENTASLRLHQGSGFRIVGTRERIAQMTHGPFDGQWRDVILIERRSRHR